MQVRTGVKPFDKQWDGNVPTEHGASNAVVSVHKIDTSRWASDAHYKLLPVTVRNAIDGLASRGNDAVWVYYVSQITPQSLQLVEHGYVVCDEQRFPWFTLQSNRRKNSAQIMSTITIVIDSVAWDELQKAMEKELKDAFIWSAVVSDVEESPFYDRFETNGDIVGRSYLATYNAMHELVEDLTKRVRDRAEEREEYDLYQYISETLEDALDAVAETHGLYMNTEDGDVFVSKTLLSINDKAALAGVQDVELDEDDENPVMATLLRPQTIEFDDYPTGYGHSMAQPAEQEEIVIPEGTEVEIVDFGNMRVLQVEAEYGEHTYTLSVRLQDLLLHRHVAKIAHLPAGTVVDVVTINDVDDIVVETEYDANTVSLTVEFNDLILVMDHKE